MKLRQTWITVLPAAALIVAGCGGGGDDSTESAPPPAAVTTTAALTKAELIEQGDAICAEVNAAVGTVGASSAESGSPAGQVADLYSGMVGSLNNLGAPSESAGYSEFSAAAEELAKAEGEVKLATERSDTAGLEVAESKASSALASFQTVAQEYGFEECGEGPSAPPVTAVPESGETGSAEAPEEAAPEAAEPEVEPEAAPEVAPETGGAGGTAEGAGGGTEGGGTTGGSSGGIGPG